MHADGTYTYLYGFGTSDDGPLGLRSKCRTRLLQSDIRVPPGQCDIVAVLLLVQTAIHCTCSVASAAVGQWNSVVAASKLQTRITDTDGVCTPRPRPSRAIFQYGAGMLPLTTKTDPGIETLKRPLTRPSVCMRIDKGASRWQESRLSKVTVFCVLELLPTSLCLRCRRL